MNNNNSLIVPILKREVHVSSRTLLGFCATVPHVSLACNYYFMWSQFTCPTRYHPSTCYQQTFMLVTSIVHRYLRLEQAVTPKHSRLPSDHFILHWSDAVCLNYCVRSWFWHSSQVSVKPSLLLTVPCAIQRHDVMFQDHLTVPMVF